MIKVFISYSTTDRDFAEHLCEYLEKNEKKCWIAPRNIVPGAQYGEEIIKGIESSDVFVLVYSDASNKSQHTLREVERAVNKNIPIISYRIDNSTLTKSMEYFLLTNQWLDASSDKNAMLATLDSSVEAIYNGKTVEELKLSEKKPKSKLVPIIAVVAAILAVAAIIVSCMVLGGSNNGGADIGVDVPKIDVDVSGGDVDVPPVSVDDIDVPPVSGDLLKAGDYVSFGSYRPTGYSAENGDDVIKWQVLKAEGEKITLISADIIDIKPFDCAESGNFDKNSNDESFDRKKADLYSAEELSQFRGSNVWANSDIRAWLNSSGVVSYSSSSQEDATTDEDGNGFTNQLGFLTDFTETEKALMINTSLGDGINDLVYLLSVEEIDEYAKNDTFILHPSVTKSAIASDETSWYDSYRSQGADDYIWVTRTPSTEKACDIYIVNSLLSGDNTYATRYSAASGFGIRPVITVCAATSLAGGDGSRTSPYTIY